MRDCVTNAEFLRMLGITQRNVTYLRVECCADELPTVTIESVLFAHEIQSQTQQFHLLAIDPPTVAPEPPPFDVDKACAEALQRLRRGIDASAMKHARQLRDFAWGRALVLGLL